MHIAKTIKTLSIVAATALGLQAGASQADFEPRHAAYNPWLAHQPAHGHYGFKQQLARFEQRMDNQMQRILGGMEQGRLTLREAVALLQEHVAISALEREYLADGRLGPRELFDLERRLDQASQNIRFEKRDAERVGFAEQRYGGYRQR